MSRVTTPIAPIAPIAPHPARAAALQPAATPRVLLLTRDDPVRSTGGVETFCRQLQRVFPGSEVVAYSGAAGPRRVCNEARDARAILPRLCERVATSRPDAIVANGAAAWAIGPRLAQELAIPLITTYHGTYAGFGRAIAPVAGRRGFLARTYGAFLERRAGRGRAAVVAVSARVAAEADVLYDVPARILENCASLDGTPIAPRETARERLAIAAASRVVLFVGRAERTKGFDLVVELARRRRDAVVLAAGVAPAADHPANLRALGVQTPAQLAELYAAADAVVLPSWYEGCPFALLDAIHADRPIVTTATGCFPDAGLHPWGIVLPGVVREAFFSCTDAVLAEPRRFTPRAAAGARFSFARFARDWRALLDEVLGKPQVPHAG